VTNLYTLTILSKGFIKSSRVVCIALTLKTAPRSDAVSI
jgi:hypothetical protein